MSESVGNDKQLVAVEIPAKGEHPWMPFVGQFENDPLYDKWQKAISEYRSELDTDDAE